MVWQLSPCFLSSVADFPSVFLFLSYCAALFINFLLFWRIMAVRACQRMKFLWKRNSCGFWKILPFYLFQNCKRKSFMNEIKLALWPSPQILLVSKILLSSSQDTKAPLHCIADHEETKHLIEEKMWKAVHVLSYYYLHYSCMGKEQS